MEKSMMTETCSAVLRSRRNLSSDGAERTDKDLSCYSNKNKSLSSGTCPYDHWLTNKAYLSAITMADIYQSFTYKTATKINWHIRPIDMEQTDLTVSLCIAKPISNARTARCQGKHAYARDRFWSTINDPNCRNCFRFLPFSSSQIFSKCVRPIFAQFQDWQPCGRRWLLQTCVAIAQGTLPRQPVFVYSIHRFFRDRQRPMCNTVCAFGHDALDGRRYNTRGRRSTSSVDHARQYTDNLYVDICLESISGEPKNGAIDSWP